MLSPATWRERGGEGQGNATDDPVTIRAAPSRPTTCRRTRLSSAPPTAKDDATQQAQQARQRSERRSPAVDCAPKAFDGGQVQRRSPSSCCSRQPSSHHRPRDKAGSSRPTHAASFGARRAEHQASRAADPRRPALLLGGVELSLDPSELLIVGAPIQPELDGRRSPPSRTCSPRGMATSTAEGLWGFTEDEVAHGAHAANGSAARRCSSSFAPSKAVSADDASFEARSRWRIIEERTRDQSYRLDLEGFGVGEPHRRPEIDALLALYVRPRPSERRDARSTHLPVHRGAITSPRHAGDGARLR